MNSLMKTNLQTLAHATELASRIIHEVAGEAIATTIDGKVVTNNQIRHAVAAKMQGCLIREGDVK